MAKFSHYAIAAARQAIDDSNWKPETDEQKEKTVNVLRALRVYIYIFNHR